VAFEIYTQGQWSWKDKVDYRLYHFFPFRSYVPDY